MPKKLSPKGFFVTLHAKNLVIEIFFSHIKKLIHTNFKSFAINFPHCGNRWPSFIISSHGKWLKSRGSHENVKTTKIQVWVLWCWREMAFLSCQMPNLWYGVMLKGIWSLFVTNFTCWFCLEVTFDFENMEENKHRVFWRFSVEMDNFWHIYPSHRIIRILFDGWSLQITLACEVVYTQNDPIFLTLLWFSREIHPYLKMWMVHLTGNWAKM